MKKIILAMGMVFVGVLSLTSTLSADVKEGQWSMTIVTQMPGMNDEMAAAMQGMSPEEKAMMQQMMGGMNIGMNPDSGGMTTTTKTCVTNENPVPEVEEGCTSTHTLNGSTVNFEQTCPDSHSTGEITYQDETMQGTINSKQTENGQTTDVTIELSGQYVGPCPAE